MEFSTKDLGRHALNEHSIASVCGSGFELPTIRQLQTLTVTNVTDSNASVSWPYFEQDNGVDIFKHDLLDSIHGVYNEFVYTDNQNVKVCTLDGVPSGGGTAGRDQCVQISDSRYVYWSSTPYGEKKCFDGLGNVIEDVSESTCNQPNQVWDSYYLAMDFDKKQVYIAPPTSQFASRCVANVKCGDSILQGDEQCEFFPDGTERVANNQCLTNEAAQKLAPYTAGGVHCDPQSCQLRFDNCVLATDPSPISGFCLNGFSECSNDADCEGDGNRCVSRNSCEEICTGIVEAAGNRIVPGTDINNRVGATQLGNFIKSFGVNLTENYLAINEQNNTDQNRRPLFGLRCESNPTRTCSVDSDCAGAGSCTPGYIKRQVGRDSVYVYDNPVNGGSYGIADDGKKVSGTQSLCQIISGQPVDEQNGTSCDLGFVIGRAIANWDVFEDSNDLYTQGTPLVTNQLAERTLCNCAVPLPETSIEVEGSDITQLIDLNDAEQLVRLAELEYGSANFINAFNNAQAAVNGLYTAGQISNTAAIDTLQDRLNLLAENYVLRAEELLGTSIESFSRWSLDEGRGRIGYNSGPGRATLLEGAGGNLKVGTQPGGTLNVSWPVGAQTIGNSDAYSDPDYVNQGIFINGDDYLYTDVSSGNQGDATISFWVQPQFEETPIKQTLWSVRNDTTTYSLNITETNEFEFNCGSTTTGGTVSSNWNFVSIVYTGNLSSVSVYAGLNDTQAPQQIIGPIACVPLELDSTDQYVFGALYDPLTESPYSQFMTGTFDEVRVYYSDKSLDLQNIKNWEGVSQTGSVALRARSVALDIIKLLGVWL